MDGQTEIENAPIGTDARPDVRVTDGQSVVTGSAALAEFDNAARAHVDRGRNRNTRDAYASDRRAWSRYCEQFDLPEDLWTVGTVLGYIEWMHAAGRAPKTIERRITGTRLSLIADDIPAELSEADQKTVVERIRQIKRELAETGERRGRGKAKAITVAELRKISAALPNTLAGLRDRALLLIGFGMAARRSELAGLWAADIEVCPDGLCITLRADKTNVDDQDIAIPYGTSDLTCPVRAWVAYRAAVETVLGGELDGKAFRRIDRHGRVLAGMSGKAVGEAFQRAAAGAGIAGERVTAHGLRSGLATASARAGHRVQEIAAQGRWSLKSPTVHTYVQTANRWDENAVKGIGL